MLDTRQLSQNLKRLILNHLKNGALTLSGLVVDCLSLPEVQQRVGVSPVVKARKALAAEASAHNLKDDVLLEWVIDATQALFRSVNFPESSEIFPIHVLLAIVCAADDQDDNPAVRIVRGHLLEAGVTWQSLHNASAGRSRVIYEPLGYGSDLCAMAKTLPRCPLFGQEALLREIAVHLYAHSACLIGEPGVGKSAVVRGLAWHLSHPEHSSFVVESMTHWKIVSLTRSDVIAGTSDRGALEQRLKDLLDYLHDHPEVILFLDEVHSLLDARDEEGAMIINALKPAMADPYSTLRVIAATTDREYEYNIMPDDALHTRFAPTFTIPEPTLETTLMILRQRVSSLPSLWQDTAFEVADSELSYAIELSDRNQRQDCQPRKALKLLDRLYYQKRFEAESTGASPAAVDRPFVLEIASQMWKIRLAAERPAFWSSLAAGLVAAAPAQEKAASALAALLLRLSRRQCSPRPAGTPMARVLFLHQGGREAVSLEAMLSALRRLMFEDERAGDREDMREFASENARTRFVGAPPAFIGFGETRTVLSKMRARPQGGVLHLANLAPDRPHPALLPDLESLLSGTSRDAAGRPVDSTQWMIVLSILIPPDIPATLPEAPALLLPPGLAALVDLVCPLMPETVAAEIPAWDHLLADWQARGLPLPEDPASLRAAFEAWFQATGGPAHRFLDFHFQALAEKEITSVPSQTTEPRHF